MEISPIRLIRRIKNGLEIPGLKEALIKILQDFHLQISLLEGCQTILNGDSMDLSRRLHLNQSGGFFLSSKSSFHMRLNSLLTFRQLPHYVKSARNLCKRRHSPLHFFSSVVTWCMRHASVVPRIFPYLKLIQSYDHWKALPRASVEASRCKPTHLNLTNPHLTFAFSESMIKARINRGCPACHASGQGQVSLRL